MGPQEPHKTMNYEQLTGSQKAAILILSLSNDLQRKMLSDLGEDNTERILSSISQLKDVPHPVQRKVAVEFARLLQQSQSALSGGPEQALHLIDNTLDTSQAQKLRPKFGNRDERIDWVLEDYEPEFIAETLSEDHPQTLALILRDVLGALEDLTGRVTNDEILDHVFSRFCIGK